MSHTDFWATLHYILTETERERELISFENLVNKYKYMCVYCTYDI